MGRREKSKRPTVERLARDSLDVRELKRLGLLQHEPMALSALMRWPSVRRIVSTRYWLTLEFHGRGTEQRIRVSWTPCRLGGWRPWMHCPYCETRVAKLLSAMGGYRCRECIGKPLYASQTTSANGRRHFEICKVRLQLGGMAALTEPFPDRPRGMHRKTYAKLKARAYDLDADLPQRYRKRTPDYRNLAHYIE